MNNSQQSGKLPNGGSQDLQNQGQNQQVNQPQMGFSQQNQYYGQQGIPQHSQPFMMHGTYQEMQQMYHNQIQNSQENQNALKFAQSQAMHPQYMQSHNQQTLQQNLQMQHQTKNSQQQEDGQVHYESELEEGEVGDKQVQKSQAEYGFQQYLVEESKPADNTESEGAAQNWAGQNYQQLPTQPFEMQKLIPQINLNQQATQQIEANAPEFANQQASKFPGHIQKVDIDDNHDFYQELIQDQQQKTNEIDDQVQPEAANSNILESGEEAEQDENNDTSQISQSEMKLPQIQDSQLEIDQAMKDQECSQLKSEQVQSQRSQSRQSQKDNNECSYHTANDNQRQSQEQDKQSNSQQTFKEEQSAVQSLVKDSQEIPQNQASALIVEESYEQPFSAPARRRGRQSVNFIKSQSMQQTVEDENMASSQSRRGKESVRGGRGGKASVASKISTSDKPASTRGRGRGRGKGSVSKSSVDQESLAKSSVVKSRGSRGRGAKSQVSETTEVRKGRGRPRKVVEEIKEESKSSQISSQVKEDEEMDFELINRSEAIEAEAIKSKLLSQSSNAQVKSQVSQQQNQEPTLSQQSKSEKQNDENQSEIDAKSEQQSEKVSKSKSSQLQQEIQKSETEQEVESEKDQTSSEEQDEVSEQNQNIVRASESSQQQSSEKQADKTEDEEETPQASKEQSEVDVTKSKKDSSSEQEEVSEVQSEHRNRQNVQESSNEKEDQQMTSEDNQVEDYQSFDNDQRPYVTVVQGSDKESSSHEEEKHSQRQMQDEEFSSEEEIQMKYSPKQTRQVDLEEEKDERESLLDQVMNMSDDDEEEGEYIPHTESDKTDDHVIDENAESEQFAIQEQDSGFMDGKDLVMEPFGQSDNDHIEQVVEQIQPRQVKPTKKPALVDILNATKNSEFIISVPTPKKPAWAAPFPYSSSPQQEIEKESSKISVEKQQSPKKTSPKKIVATKKQQAKSTAETIEKPQTAKKLEAAQKKSQAAKPTKSLSKEKAAPKKQKVQKEAKKKSPPKKQEEVVESRRGRKVKEDVIPKTTSTKKLSKTPVKEEVIKPIDTRRSKSPVPVAMVIQKPQKETVIKPQKVKMQASPAKAKKQVSPAKAKKQVSPAKAKKQVSPAKAKKQVSPAKVKAEKIKKVEEPRSSRSQTKVMQEAPKKAKPSKEKSVPAKEKIEKKPKAEDKVSKSKNEKPISKSKEVKQQKVEVTERTTRSTRSGVIVEPIVKPETQSKSKVIKSTKISKKNTPVVPDLSLSKRQPKPSLKLKEINEVEAELKTSKPESSKTTRKLSAPASKPISKSKISTSKKPDVEMLDMTLGLRSSSRRSQHSSVAPHNSESKTKSLKSEPKSVQKIDSCRVSKSKFIDIVSKAIKPQSKEKSEKKQVSSKPVSKTKQVEKIKPSPLGFGFINDCDVQVEKKGRGRPPKQVENAPDVLKNKREAKAEMKAELKSESKKQIDKVKPKSPSIAPKPQKFQKKDKTIEKPMSCSEQFIQSQLKIKHANKFMNLFKTNPFLKSADKNKTLIATPSKFEIRSKPKQTQQITTRQTRNMSPKKESKSVVEAPIKSPIKVAAKAKISTPKAITPRTIGIRSKLTKVAHKSVSKKEKSPKINDKSKKIDKKKLQVAVFKANLKAKVEKNKKKAQKKAQILKEQKQIKQQKKLDKMRKLKEKLEEKKAQKAMKKADKLAKLEKLMKLAKFQKQQKLKSKTTPKPKVSKKSLILKKKDKVAKVGMKRTRSQAKKLRN